MNSLLSARKRADEFEALLNGAPTGRADLSELAGVAAALRRHAPVAPRPDFAAALREQLMVEAATVLTVEAKTLALPTRRATHQRRLVAAATAVVFVGGTAGMAAASQGALPGDTLYPIKRTIERAQAGLNTSDAAKGTDILGQAGDRLGEVQGLLGQSSSAPLVRSTIDDFSEQAEQGSALLIKSFETDRNPEDIARVREFTASSLAVLQELAKTAPPKAQEALAQAAQLLQALDKQALGLCSQCAPDLPPLALTSFLLASSGVTEAIEAAAGGKVDNNRVDTTKPNKPADKPGKAQAPTKQEPAAKPPTGAVDPEATVKKPTKKLNETVDETLDPVTDVVDEVLPGVGELLDTLTEPITGPLLGGG